MTITTVLNMHLFFRPFLRFGMYCVFIEKTTVKTKSDRRPVELLPSAKVLWVLDDLRKQRTQPKRVTVWSLFLSAIFSENCILFIPPGLSPQDPPLLQKHRPFVESLRGLVSSAPSGTPGRSRGCPWRRSDPGRSWRTPCIATCRNQTALKLPKGRWGN